MFSLWSLIFIFTYFSFGIWVSARELLLLFCHTFANSCPSRKGSAGWEEQCSWLGGQHILPVFKLDCQIRRAVPFWPCSTLNEGHHEALESHSLKGKWLKVEMYLQVHKIDLLHNGPLIPNLAPRWAFNPPSGSLGLLPWLRSLQPWVLVCPVLFW